MSKTKTKPLCQDVVHFVRHHLGKDCFAPLTGGDWPAWHAFVHLVQAYAHGGGQNAIAAMRCTVKCAQPTTAVLRCFVQAIPAVMDWSDVARLWPLVGDLWIREDNTTYDARLIHAIEIWGEDPTNPKAPVRRTLHGVSL